jgi:hypothetical protein
VSLVMDDFCQKIDDYLTANDTSCTSINLLGVKRHLTYLICSVQLNSAFFCRALTMALSAMRSTRCRR